MWTPPEHPALLPQHAALLRASAISSEVAEARGYRSVEHKARLTELGFSSTQARVPALLIPIRNVHGEIALYQTRADEPRSVAGKAVKYETPLRSRMVVDVPPSCQKNLGNPSVPLFVTEGVRKADAAASLDLCCVALLGVWNFRGSNEFVGTTALADWESVALKDRVVYIVFDSDVVTKSGVHQALVRLQAFLMSRDAQVRIVYLPPGTGAIKVGLDDYLAAGHTVRELLALATTELRSSPPAPKPVQPAATPTLTLAETLDATVAHLTRYVHFARAEHADAVALWTAHTHARLEHLGQATAGIGGLPDTILDRAIVITMQRRTRGEPVEKLRERAARALGTPLRHALAYHVGRLEDLTVSDDALPAELDDRAQDGWEPLVAISDAAGGDWPGRARRAAVAIFGSRSAADDNPGLRLLADCRDVFAGSTEEFLPTTELRTALIALDQSAWADIRGREITPHYLGKLLRTFGIESKRSRPSGVGNPVHGYFRAHFRDAWERYVSVPQATGTSGTTGTTNGSGSRSETPAVPDVPDVPDAEPIDPR